MRGGAIPVLVWGTILAVALALVSVWTGRGIVVGVAGFAVGATFATALAVILLRPREALRRGPPEPSPEPRAVASASVGSVLLAIGAAALVYGLAFGRFLIFFGAGLMVVATAILAREKLAQRRALRQWRQGER